VVPTDKNDCKQYEDQRATMIDILSEKSKKNYPKSVKELLRLEEKRFLQGVCSFINNIPIFIYSRYVREVEEVIALIIYSIHSFKSRSIL
jgi:hypothetical protein